MALTSAWPASRLSSSSSSWYAAPAWASMRAACTAFTRGTWVCGARAEAAAHHHQAHPEPQRTAMHWLRIGLDAGGR
jgi:hypothetical protein